MGCVGLEGQDVDFFLGGFFGGGGGGGFGVGVGIGSGGLLLLLGLFCRRCECP